MILAVKTVMTIATLFFAAGFFLRVRNNDLHRKLMIMGMVTTLGIAVVLVVGVNIFDASYRPAEWLVSMAGGADGAQLILIIHRIFATLALLLLIAQVYSGALRRPLHKKLPKFVVSAWLISYFSGMVIFS